MSRVAEIYGNLGSQGFRGLQLRERLVETPENHQGRIWRNTSEYSPVITVILQKDWLRTGRTKKNRLASLTSLQMTVSRGNYSKWLHFCFGIFSSLPRIQHIPYIPTSLHVPLEGDYFMLECLTGHVWLGRSSSKLD